jgi:hypothetical protein
MENGKSLMVYAILVRWINGLSCIGYFRVACYSRIRCPVLFTDAPACQVWIVLRIIHNVNTLFLHDLCEFAY